MSTKINSIPYVIICFILTPFLSVPSPPLLPSPLKLQYFTTPNEWVQFVCVKICRVFLIRDRKYRFEINSMCLINDYSHIADLHIFVYGSAECATTSLECTNVKLLLLILNNFDDQSILYKGIRSMVLSRKWTQFLLNHPVAKMLEEWSR